MKTTHLLMLAVFALCLFPRGSQADGDWKTLKTDHFVVFYKPDHEWQAWEALRNLEHFRPSLMKLTGNPAPPRTAIVIQDAGDYSNGFTDFVDEDIQLFTEPPSASLGLPDENWWTLLTTHEYTHLCHLTHTFGFPDFMTKAFGNLFNPNLLLPSWAEEGFAVYSESKVSPYSGRLNDGFFDAYYAVSAQEGHFPSLLKATFAPFEYPGDIMYEGGAGFYRYLAQTYGEEKFANYYSDYGTNVLSYVSGFLPLVGLDAAAGNNFKDKSIPVLWKDWENSVKDQAEDAAPDGTALTRQGWELDGLAIEDGHLYSERYYPVKTGVYSAFGFNEITDRNLSTGETKTLVSTTSYFTLPLRVHGRKLYYGVAEVRPGYDNTASYGYYSEVHEKDLDSGNDRVLFRGQIRGFDALPGGWVLFSTNRRGTDGCELHLYDPSMDHTEFLFNEDWRVDEITASQDRVVVSAQKSWGQFNLCQLDLETGQLTPFLPSPYLERNPQLGVGKVYFNANFGKHYSLYEYDFESRKLFRLTQKGYAAWPACDEENGKVYFGGLNSGGMDLYVRDYDPQPFKLPKDKPSEPPVFELKEDQVKKGGYDEDLAWMNPKALHSLYNWFDGSERQLGIALAGTDALYQFAYAALPIYNFGDQQVEADLALSCLFFAPFTLAAEYSGINDNSLYLQAAYPFFVKLNPGMTQLAAGLNLGVRDGVTNPELDPFLVAGFNYPQTSALLFLTTPLERRDWGSSQNRTAAYVYGAIRQYLPSSQLSLGGYWIEDAQATGTVLPTLRGYSNALPGNEGWAFSEDFQAPLVKIHDGFWNPSVYFQDLVLSLFSDQAFDNLGGTQWSYGLSLHLETKFTNTYTGYPEDMGLRFTRNQQGENRVEAFFDVYDWDLANFARTPVTSGEWTLPHGTPPLATMERFVEHPANPLF